MPDIPETPNNVFVSPSSFLFEHARSKVIARYGELVTPSKTVRQESDNSVKPHVCEKEAKKIK